MVSRNMLKLGVTMGHLRIHLEGELEETLKILYRQNGEKFFSIRKNPDSRLSNETDIANFHYKNISDLENYVRKKAKEIYPTSWYKALIGISKVEVTYQKNEISGVERAEERSRRNRPGL